MVSASATIATSGEQVFHVTLPTEGLPTTEKAKELVKQLQAKSGAAFDALIQSSSECGMHCDEEEEEEHEVDIPGKRQKV